VEQNSEAIQLVLALRLATEPIEGELIEPSALAGPFRGWLALASLIEAARSVADDKRPPMPGVEPQAPAEDQGASPM
jgi:hypothetical protein